MDLRNFVAPTALALALLGAAAPASADPGDQNGRDRARQNSSRSTGRQERAVRTDDRSRTNRSEASARSNDRRSDSRQYDSRSSDSRGYGSRQYDSRQYDSRQYDSRQYDSRRYDDRRYDSRGYGGGSLLGLLFGSRSGLQFGIGAGRPYSYRWTNLARIYGMRGSYFPGLAYGGVSFFVNPPEASVYVDGVFVGVARNLGTGQPVPIAAGVHRIELVAPGLAPVAWDVDVIPGQVIPFQGALQYGYQPNGYLQNGYQPNQPGYQPNQPGYVPNQPGYQPNQPGYQPNW